MEDETVSTPVWSKQPGEPANWYARFFDYYLPQGPNRSLLRAFITYLEVERPEALEKFRQAHRTSANPQWTIAARDYNWRSRAQAYDQSKMEELPNVIEAARRKLMSSAEKAAIALENALQNPRLTVAAAKEILDRAGLPANSVQTVRHVPFTADELAEAKREVAAWEKNLTGSEPNG